jgi:hypothetical protein
LSERSAGKLREKRESQELFSEEELNQKTNWKLAKNEVIISN